MYVCMYMHLMLGQRATFNRQVTLIQIQGGFRFKYVRMYVCLYVFTCMCVSLSYNEEHDKHFFCIVI